MCLHHATSLLFPKRSFVTRQRSRAVCHRASGSDWCVPLSNLPIPQLRSEPSVSLDPSTRSRAHNPEWTQMIIILMQGPLSSGQMKAIPALSVGCWKPVLVRHLLDSRRRSELPQHLRRSLRRTPAPCRPASPAQSASYGSGWRLTPLLGRGPASVDDCMPPQPSSAAPARPPDRRVFSGWQPESGSQPGRLPGKDRLRGPFRGPRRSLRRGPGILRGLEAGLIVLQRRE